jgi:hypothetical protein
MRAPGTCGPLEPLEIRRADTFRRRLLGVRAWRDWESGAWGLLLPRCRVVHTLGLAWPIDVVFVSRAGAILGLRPRLAPNRWAGCRFAWGALELPPGYCADPGWSGRVSAAWGALKIDV